MSKGNIGLMKVLFTVLINELGVQHTHGMSLSIEHEGILLALLDLPWGIYTKTQH